MGSMNLIEKVLQGTEHCAAMNGLDCSKCEYRELEEVPTCTVHLTADCNKVIKQLQEDNKRLDKENQKLLEQMAELNRKEQARKPADVQKIRKGGTVIGWCEDKRCRECGQAQDWSDT